ncbi:beta-N-acetylhexosaminidase [Paraferrimonas haliotis]|uniref:beta-N-acetylhexosaminidase n=1 Tax=Paraferrimonas haliotis TaxID=2013866 RepID=UPI000BA900B6
MSYLMMDLVATSVSSREAQLLQAPCVGGLILFSRNYVDKSQLKQLIKQVRSIRPDLLIAVDHEGGRVQRFIKDFNKIPAMGSLIKRANGDIERASLWANELGWLMAAELLNCGIDLSFAPVLDRNGISDVIGERAFSDDPKQIVQLASAFIEGMNQAGMHAVGKHFPGHGSVKADSHVASPIDNRSFEQVWQQDSQPFVQCANAGLLSGLMPAHVIFDNIDPNPAGFSSFWLQTIVRQKMAFGGTLFSDDLSMHGAATVGDYPSRIKAALEAGCDMLLLCNCAEALEEVISQYPWPQTPPHSPGQNLCSHRLWHEFQQSQPERYRQAVEYCSLLA